MKLQNKKRKCCGMYEKNSVIYVRFFYNNSYVNEVIKMYFVVKLFKDCGPLITIK